MKAYLGQTNGRQMTRRVQLLGVGEMTQRGQLPPKRFPWAYDNGAFSDHLHGRPFDQPAFEADLEWIAALPGAVRPDFLVAPDRVGAGMDSLELSLAWASRLAVLGPVYLAVQDGMAPAAISDAARGFGGLFVGGTREWKRATLEQWAAAARRLGIACHVGRASTPRFVDACYAAGATSIDSSQPLWSVRKLRAWVGAWRQAPRQRRLFPTTEAPC